MPSAVRLQLVSPTRELPGRPGWVHEPKIDGVRLLLGKDGSTVQLRLRGGGLVQRAFPEVVEAMRRLRAEHVVLDGELVVLDASGQADFDSTCARLRSESPCAGPPVVVYAFDCLGLDGADLRPRPLRERKALLSAVLGAGDAVLKPVHFTEGTPEPLVESVKELGFEGVVSKYLGAPYQGGRSSLWKKLVLRRPEKGWRIEGTRRRPQRHAPGPGALGWPVPPSLIPHPPSGW
ncbi:MAG: ATP-dependent DNA ligase [Archangium sp.]